VSGPAGSAGPTGGVPTNDFKDLDLAWRSLSKRGMSLTRLSAAVLLLLGLTGEALAAHDNGEREQNAAPAKIVVVRSWIDGRAVRKVYQVKPLVDAEGRAVTDLAVSR
jgi:hypothetical protein